MFKGADRAHLFSAFLPGQLLYLYYTHTCTFEQAHIPQMSKRAKWRQLGLTKMAKTGEAFVFSRNPLMVKWVNKTSFAAPLHGYSNVPNFPNVGVGTRVGDVGSVTISRPFASSPHLNESRAPNSQMAAVAYFHKDGLMQT